MANAKSKAVVAIGVIDVARHAAKAWSANAERKERESRTLGVSGALESARESADHARGSILDGLRKWGDTLSDSRAAELAQSTPDRARSAREAAVKAERKYARQARRRMHDSPVPDRIGGRNMPWKPSRTEQMIDHLPLVGSLVAAAVMVVAAVAYAVRHNQPHDTALDAPHGKINADTDASEVTPQEADRTAGDSASAGKLHAVKDAAAGSVSRVKGDAAEMAHRVTNAGGAAIDAGATKLAASGSRAAAGTSALAGASKQAVKDHVVDEVRHQVDERVVQPVKKKAITFGLLGFIGLTVWVAVIAVAVQLGIQALS